MFVTRQLAAILCLFILCGCGDYTTNRLLDFKDSFILSGGFHLGLNVEAQVTEFFKPSLGPYIKTRMVEIGKTTDRSRRGDIFPKFLVGEEGVSWFIKEQGAIFIYDNSEENGLVEQNVDRILGVPTSDHQLSDIIDRFDIVLSVQAISPHLRIGFSPGQFIDFLFGWFGIDIAGDDE